MAGLQNFNTRNTLPVFLFLSAKAMVLSVLLLGSFMLYGQTTPRIALTVGSPCVGTNMVFTLQGSGCSAYGSWYINVPSYTYTKVSESSTSLTIRFNTTLSNVYVGANYNCTGSTSMSTVYSSQYSIADWVSASVSVSPLTPAFCANSTTTFTATATNTGESPIYSWYVDGNLVKSAYHDNTYAPAPYTLSAGTHTLRVLMYSSAPCISNTPEATTTFTVYSLPGQGTLSVSPRSIFYGQSVSVSSTGGTGAPHYWCSNTPGQWNIFSQAYGGQYSFQHTPSAPGNYRYELYNKTECGFCFQLPSCLPSSGPSGADVFVDLPAPQVYGNVTMPLLPNASITASSCWNGCVGGSHEAWRGRLFDQSGNANWSAQYNDANQYLQVDLGAVKSVDGVLTQGRYNTDQVVTSYKLSYSLDGTTWTGYPQTFTGSNDRNTVARNDIANPFPARYVRIIPVTWTNHISMRAEIISVPNKGSHVTFIATQPYGTDSNRWYESATGGTPVYTGKVFTTQLVQDKTYYASSYNTGTGWESSTRTPVTGRVKPTPGEQDLNFVVTNTLQIPGIRNASDVAYLSLNGQKGQSIAYFDGLGRPIQSVVTQGSPSRKDIVQPVEYDRLGREIWKYLPYTSGENGFYKPNATNSAYGSSDQFAFYRQTAAQPDGRAWDDSARVQTDYEKSPLNRVLEQAAPGSDWAIVRDGTTKLSTKAGRTVLLNYRTNALNEVRRWSYSFASGAIDGTSPYGVGELTVTETTDEHRNKTSEYKDKQGRVVLRQVQETAASFLSTAYVYDDMGYLRYVLPPEAVARLATSEVESPYKLDPDNPLKQKDKTFQENWCFRYRYDARGRMTHKQVPGAGETYLVYNKRDELILTQDGKQRPGREWSYTKYDALGRVVQTGIYTHTTVVDQSAMQGLAGGAAAVFETRNPDVAGFDTHLGYTSGAFPTGSTLLLTVNYYDDYDFNNNGTADVSFDATAAGGMLAPVTSAATTKGKPTSNKVRILPAGNWLTSVTYYDADGKVVQTVTDNHVGGKETNTLVLDFTGKPLQSKLVHTTSLPGAAALTVLKGNGYDHAGRLLSITQSTNGGPEEKLAQMSYNELGQLKQKKVGLDVTTSAVLQTMDYRYNIRGWLTSINDPDPAQPNPDQDLFWLELGYNQGGQYNGNIAFQKWRSATDNILRSYSYSYDPLNRLTRAVYSGAAGESYSTTGFDGGGSTETGMRYDRNGNLLTLGQYGLQSLTSSTDRQWGLVDKLAYAYQGNRLRSVADGGTVRTAPGPAADFVDGATLEEEYLYDDDQTHGKGNGNLSEDKNKQITSILYNHLNLPTRIVFEGNTGKRIDYRYDAGGRKLNKTVYEPGKAQVSTDYVSGMVYVNGQLQFFGHEEGRVLSPQLVNQSGFAYEYHYKDHLGNLRVSFRRQSPVASQSTLSFEPQQAAVEEASFQRVSTSRAQGVAQQGSYAARLQREAGPSKTLRLLAGERLKASVFAHFEQPKQRKRTWLPLPIVQEEQTSFDGRSRRRLALRSGVVLPLSFKGKARQVPEAFLELIVRDTTGRITLRERRKLDQSAKAQWQELSIDYKAQGEETLEVSLSNESSQAAYFDNLTLSQEPAIIVQENHYSPWGLNLAGIEKQGTPDHKWQYIGREKQEELGLNWLDLQARMYDPQLGRFHAVDPLPDTERQESLTPYQYSWNNPIRFSDPDGKCPKCDEVMSFVHGVGSALADDFASADGGGLPINNQPSNPDAYNSGRVLGHAIGVVGGIVETAAGTAGTVFVATVEVGSGGLATPVAVPAGIATTAVTAHGANSFGNAVNNLRNDKGRVKAEGMEGARDARKEALKGQAPKGVDRVDIPKTDPNGKPLHGQKSHAHVQNAKKKPVAINQDGSYKHGEGPISEQIKQWLIGHGWKF